MEQKSKHIMTVKRDVGKSGKEYFWGYLNIGEFAIRVCGFYNKEDPSKISFFGKEKIENNKVTNEDYYKDPSDDQGAGFGGGFNNNDDVPF